MILDHFELHFGILWLSGGCPGLPWGALGPLGRQGDPKSGSGSEKLVRWTPPSRLNPRVPHFIFVSLIFPFFFFHF